MKKQYVAPEIEIVEFEIKDIITHSLATGNGDTGGRLPWGGWSWSADGQGFNTTLD